MSENARTSRLAALGNKISRFFRDIKNELKKVIWPTREQLVKSTISVLAICFLIGVVIWISDAILGKLVEWTLTR
ncbi:MAG: preprotein translocase subunit SecE [Acetivibrionales bacterium]|jgi:preprotein translocase subunit SecE|nr:preprotein translocase subunit SecE [Bacillota bacterium]NLP08428.1 preprotein translocase subunit SecE [Clostridiaceae bacterium]HOA55787.1 preprotein translocase subunit SecE [Clostridiales bacterium]HPZ05508.1 preprotein translocase subunit SecE [Clostridiales bacterium]HQD31737.1 preprotein translocase subunit SecE [Clostridiales bacterium]